MKKLLIIIGVASTVFATSCKKGGFCKKGRDSVMTETRNVSSFTGVNSEGAFDVHITTDETLEDGTVRIEAPSDLMKYIETEVNNNILTIDNKKCFRGDNDIHIYVSSKEINDISLSGSGNISSENLLSTTNMKIELSGSGNIETDLEVSSLNEEITGSGNIKSYGNTDSQTLKITGSGNIQNFNLISETANVSIDGSGNVEVYASESLDVDIDGSGNVTYKGGASVTSSVNGSGTLSNDN